MNVQSQAVSLLRSDVADDLWASLRSDGFLVDVRESGAGILVDVSAGEAPCADCLVPADIIRSIVRSYLDDEGVAAEELPIDVRLPADLP
jgi:hypothetical protein